MKATILAMFLTFTGQCENPETIAQFVDCHPEETEIQIADIEPCYDDECDGLEEAVVDPE